MKKLSIVLVVFFGMFACFCTACGGKSNKKLRLSEVTHSVFYAPLYVAINNGYFEEQGIEIDLTNAGGSDTVMTSLISGSADVGLLGPEAVVYVKNNGMKNVPKIFAQLTACDGSMLVGRTDEGSSFTWEGLKGKHIIGGRKGGMPAMTLQYILEQHGLKPGSELGENVDTILDTSIAFNLTASSFVAGTGDYCTMFEPTASQCEIDQTGYIVSSLGSEVSDIPYTVFTATSSFMKKHPEKLEKFMIALKKGYNYLMSATDSQIVASLKPSFSTTSDTLILAAVKNYISIGAYASSFVLKESSWNNMLNIIDNAGELKNRIDYKSAVDITFANKVV